MTFARRTRHGLAAALASVFAPALASSTAGAQAPARAWEISAVAGTFNYDMAGDGYVPLAGLRLARALTRYLVVDAGVGYVRLFSESSQYYEGPDGQIVRAEPRRPATPITTADVGVQLRLPLRWAQPYVGVAYGVFSLDESGLPARDRWAGARLTGAARIAAGGVRVPLGARLALRGDLRLRLDSHPGDFGGYDAFDFEQTAGLSYRF